MENNISKFFLIQNVTLQDMAEELRIPKRRILDVAAGNDEFDMKSLIAVCSLLKTNCTDLFDLPVKGRKKPPQEDSLLFDIIVGGILDACVLHRMTPNKRNVGKWAVQTYRTIKNCDKTFSLKLSNICGLTEAIVKDSLTDRPKPNKKTVAC
jgi:hypothetical protein